MKYVIYCRKSTEAEDRQVLSIDSQLDELHRTFKDVPDIEVVRVFREAHSAKAPGRPIFSEMIAAVERGEAHGIIAWHPDRLARNSVDGGRIIYLLDRGVLKDLKFPTFSFDNTPQGKLMLSVLLGFSKYYIDSLSENVRRGQRTKAERGWRPAVYPLGYKHDYATKTVIPDPEHFVVLKRLFGLALTGAYSVPQLLRIATEDWGYRMPNTRKYKGRPLALPSLYKILSNPFYAGQFRWNGRLYHGKHEPMITLEEFQRLRKLIGRPGKERPQRYSFPFTGLIRCGACGLMVTAEHRVNTYGSHYEYYHCTKRGAGGRCTQPAIAAPDLEHQLASIIERVRLDEEVLRQARDQAARDLASSRLAIASSQKNIDDRIVEINAQLSTLTDLRVRALVSDEEYLSRRLALALDRASLEEQRERLGSGNDWFELVTELNMFRNRAVSWFKLGTHQTKRLILQAIGSNFSLKDKKVSVEARKPFFLRAEEPLFLYMCASVEDVRTAFEHNETAMLDLLAQLRTIRAMAEGGCHTAALHPSEADDQQSTEGAALA